VTGDSGRAAWLARLPPMDLLGALLFQVIGQQLSVAATRRSFARIGAFFDGHLPAPAGLLAVDPAELREAGRSWRKIATLRDVAERLSDSRLDRAPRRWMICVPIQPRLPQLHHPRVIDLAPSPGRWRSRPFRMRTAIVSRCLRIWLSGRSPLPT
jgi:hypothetical protein